MKKFLWLLIFVTLYIHVSFGQVESNNFNYLINKSDIIVQGKVIDAESKWINDNRGKHIYTYASIKVDGLIKGNVTGTIQVEIPGGKAGEITEVVSNSFPVRIGEEMVLFLSSYPYKTVDGYYGKYTIYRDKVFLNDREYESEKFIAVIKNIVQSGIQVNSIDAMIKSINNLNSAFEDLAAESKSFENIPAIKNSKDIFIENLKLDKTLVNPNLLFYKPANWADKIVIKNVHLPDPPVGTPFSADDSPLYDNQNLYAAFCYANNGSAPSGNFKIKVYLDAAVIATINAASLENGFYTYYFNVSLGILAQGNHTIRVVLDCDNESAEGDETDNVYERSFNVQHLSSDPNLTPYQIAGWGDKIIVKKSTLAGNPPPVGSFASDDSPLMDSDNLYVQFAVYNNGSAASAPFKTKIYVDGVEVAERTWTSNLNQNQYCYFWNVPIGSFAQGNHTVKMVVDPDGSISEQSETDNEYSRTITVQHVSGAPQITGITPGSASAGTGSAVTITGSSFGAVKGTSKVEFFYKSGQPKIEAPVTSWSDNQIVCTVPIDIINGYPASAGTGPVTVTTPGGTSNGYSFTVTFSYGGTRWAGASPVVGYKVNENTSDVMGEGFEVQASAGSWSGAGANFTFRYDGPTSATTSSSNDVNEIMWGTTVGSLATAYYWYNGSNMVEADIVFNDNYNWSTDGSGYDIQTTCLHELGHWLNLRDLYGAGDASKVMYGFGYPGTMKRSLTTEEIDGIKWIYGAGSGVSAPSATTNAATGITTSSAMLNGTVNPNGNSTTVTFQYGLTTSYGNTITAVQSPVSGSSNVSVNAIINGLNQGTIYHYRVVAVNIGGTTYGLDQTFATSGPPIALTNTATGVTTSGAVLNGSVNPNNFSTAVIFEYGTTTSYGNTVTAIQSPVNGSSAVPVSASITGLQPGTQYHFRVDASNVNGTSLGTDQTFTTSINPPVVTTNPATNVTSTGAILNGIINPNYGSTTVTFEYGLTTSYGNTITAEQSPITGSTNVNVSKAITGLSPNTLFHFRVVGVNAGGTTNGTDRTFQTAHLIPTTITLASGNNQTNKIKKALTTPFVVTVSDIFGIPVSGVAVTFAISSAPENANGQTLSIVNATTNVSGQASTILTLGDKVGSYTVSATSSGLTGSPITFNATAVAGNPSSVSLKSGNNQSGKISSTLTQPLVVYITDEGNNPVQGITVDFNISSAPTGAIGHSLTNSSSVTGATGEASTMFTFGNKTGTYLVIASVTGITETVVFTMNATAGNPTNIVLTSGNNQSAKINTPLPNPFIVTVTDQNGNPVQGVNVSFSISSTPQGSVGQFISSADVITSVNGQASAVLTLGNKIGTYTVTATFAGLSGNPVSFTATAITGNPCVINLISGNTQSGQLNTKLANPFVVTVTDSGGNPCSGVSVIFSITKAPDGSTGYSLTNLISLTNSDGQASTYLTVGNKVGEYNVTVSVNGLSSIIFVANATAGTATGIVLSSGNNQTGAIQTPVASPFIVTITDNSGNPVQGITVTFSIFSVPSGATGQSLSVTSAVTNNNGQAASILTLGNKTGTYIVHASSPGLAGSPIIFTVTAIAGKAAIISLTSGNNQTGKINTLLQNPLIVTISDIGGNPVSGVLVNFSISGVPDGATGQLLSNINATSDQEGKAVSILTLGNKTGTYTITASSGNLSGSPITFTAIATSGAAAALSLLSGNNQTAETGKALANPFIVTVTDNDGNPVSGVSVNFAISGFPSGAFGQVLSATSTTTNNNGQSSSLLTLGNKEGNYSVTATSIGLTGSPVLFTAQATPVVGISENFYVKRYELEQNYPNPFNPSTRIGYSIPENTFVSLKIYNSLGIEIETLIGKYHNAGKYSIEWNPNGNPGGVYYCILKTEKYSEIRKIIYLK